jgi:predicted Zn-dependent protease
MRGKRLGILLFVIVAMVMAVVASCSRAPLTGRRQLILVGEPSEVELGATTYKDVLAKSKLSGDAAATRRVRTVGERIAAVTGKTDYQWEFNLIQADSVANAFCLPGGKVAVYTGIMPLAATDGQLATVMAHEISHAIARHGAERMSEMLMVQLGGIALEEALKNKTRKTVDLAEAAYGAGSTLALVLPFSRTQESEADHMGLIFMAKAGYDPQAAVIFWQKMLEQYGDKEPPQFLSTHPNSAQRIEAIKREMPEALKYYKASK